MGINRFFPMLIVLILLATLVTVPVQVCSSPSPVTVSVEMPGDYIPGKPGGTNFWVNFLIEADELTYNGQNGMIWWKLIVQVNPAVLRPFLVKTGIPSYFLYDFADQNLYSSPNNVYTINETKGKVEVSEMYFAPLPPGGAATDPDYLPAPYMLVSIAYEALSETNYTKIDLQNTAYSILSDPGTQIPMTAVDGHYNQPPKGSLSGKVVDDDSLLPIAGATISYVSGPTAFNDTSTDADGNYTIVDLELGNYSIIASTVGYGDQTKNITIIEGPNTLNFELTSIAMPPGWIEGFVIDNTTKTVIAGATVMADGAYNITNDIGYYKIENLPPKDYYVTAGAVGFPPQSKTATVTSEAGTTLNFTLESVSPYIAVVPHGTMNSSLAPGMNLTISIHTDYTGDDVWGYVFSLTYNPLILQGVEVTNGDLITEEDGKTEWIPGTFDNEVGKLTPTFNGFYFVGNVSAPLTSGPGTLATVTFQVVGIGISDITLGTEVKPSILYGYAEGGWGDQFRIIDGETEPDRIQHGFFTNVQSIHDVAIINIEAPTTAVAGGDYVPINVTVVNEGIYLEVVNLTVTIHNDTTEIRTESFLFNLASGLFRVNSFSWDTTGLMPGTYTINATATTLNPDEDPDDNPKTKQIEIITIHDVAVTNIEAQDEAAIEEIVPINVTVANKGSFYENVNVTVSYDDTLIDVTLIDMLSLRESEIVEFSWDTTGLMPGTYTINATATIASDANITNNSNTKGITLLKWSYDVAVVSIGVSPYTVYIGENVTIEVLVINNGRYNETFEVVVSYDGTYIDSENVTLASYPSPAESLSFTWNTSDLDSASYTITAEALLLTDEDLTNNIKTRSIVLNLPLGAIVGTVTDALTGDPIQGATIDANGYSDTTDADGHYNITNVPPSSYTVTVSAAKYVSQSKTATVTPSTTTTLDFALTPLNGTISGIVKDSATGDPISDAAVTVNGISVSTDVEGSYSIELAPGTYNVTVSADGYESDSKSATVDAEETTTVDFELAPTPAPNIPWQLYVATAGVAAIILAAMAFYFLRVKKPKQT